MSFEPVEWERLADHEEAPRSAASAVAPMSDERLAEIQQLAASSRAVVARHLTAALREVLAEVGRQRFEIARANQEIETLGAEVEAEHREAEEAEAEAAQLRKQLQSATVLPERWREVMAERDAARRELAEVRERVGKEGFEWRFDDGNGWFTVARKPLTDANVQHLRQQTGRPVERRVVGEWKAADGG